MCCSYGTRSAGSQGAQRRKVAYNMSPPALIEVFDENKHFAGVDNFVNSDIHPVGPKAIASKMSTKPMNTARHTAMVARLRKYSRNAVSVAR